jgi:hypothetical protein
VTPTSPSGPGRGKRTLAAAFSLLVLVPLLAAAPPAEAQEIRGTLLDGASRLPLAEAVVRLHASSGQTIDSVMTPASGLFHLRAAGPGQYRISAERQGYARSTSGDIQVAQHDTIVVQFTLDTVVVLSPLFVTARSQRVAAADVWLADFHDRKQFFGRLGPSFLLREEWDGKLAAMTVTDVVSAMVLQTVSVQTPRGAKLMMRKFGRECDPVYYVNGVLLRLPPGDFFDDHIQLYDVAAIEVYRGPSQIPADFPAMTDCGVVAVWTRRSGR